MSRDLELFIDEQVAESMMPGLSCAAVVGDSAVWSYGTGWADIEQQISMRSDTIMNVASVAKTVTATAVLRLREEKGFDLDADVGSFLGFEVRNPHHPRVPITVRQLLAHRSSIKDGPAYEAGYVCGPASESLEAWLTAFLLPDGKRYAVEENFHLWAPGTLDPPDEPRPYSNVGYGLLSLVLEKIAGISFSEYCASRLFEPLGMSDSGWFLHDVSTDKHARLYSLVPEDPEELGFGGVEILHEQLEEARAAKPGSLFKHCVYSHPIKADGMLRTSVDDLARFLALYTNGGVASGHRVLQTATLEMMLSSDHYGRALCWQGGALSDGRVRWHHGGADPGVGTLILFEPQLRLGVLIFCNYAGPAPFLSEVYARIRREFGV